MQIEWHIHVMFVIYDDSTCYHTLCLSLRHCRHIIIFRVNIHGTTFFFTISLPFSRIFVLSTMCMRFIAFASKKKLQFDLHKSNIHAVNHNP